MYFYPPHSTLRLKLTINPHKVSLLLVDSLHCDGCSSLNMNATDMVLISKDCY